MSRIVRVSRRDFLRTTGVSASFVLGVQILPKPFMASLRADGTDIDHLNLWVAIARDGTVTLTCARSEMGQGVRTGMTMILADELDADWSRCRIWQAPGDKDRYDPPGKDGQNTDGSRSTRHGLPYMRELGAQARAMLVFAAAEHWGVDPGEVTAKHHRLHHEASGRSMDFGEIAEAAANVELPPQYAPPLKDPGEWTYIGKDMPVVDNPDITTGKAVYGADVRLPGMKIAVVARPPVYRGTVKSFDATEALKVPGVEQVIEIPALAPDQPCEYRALGGVAVIGTNTWAVMQGRDRLKIEWDDGPFADHDSSTYDPALVEAARASSTPIRKRGDADAALAAADKVIEADYFVPFLAHAPMEPPVTIVDANSNPVRIISPSQDPNATRQYVAEALGVDVSGVTCEVTLLGGAFGRKSKGDFACEAAILSKAVGAPVRVQWSREDDIRHGFYHGVSAQHVKAALDADGKVTAWRHGVATPSILGLWNPAQRELAGFEAGLGLVDLPYDRIPNLLLQSGAIDVKLRVGWLRSVNNIQHAFAIHSFADELAAAAGRDSLEFMLELIGDAETLDLTKEGVAEVWNYGDSTDEWPIQPVRLANALRQVAKAAGYGRELPKGHGLGLAAHRSFQSYVATCVEVAVDDAGNVSVPRVDVAIDCGRYVNPEGIRKQIEGACIFSNSFARLGAITTTGGRVDQGNYDDYPVTRMSDSPMDIRVHLVEDYVHTRPCGVGEVGVPPYAPALANAIFAATGQRIRSLPIRGTVKRA